MDDVDNIRVVNPTGRSTLTGPENSALIEALAAKEFTALDAR